jgi:hypothetical protein
MTAGLPGAILVHDPAALSAQQAVAIRRGSVIIGPKVIIYFTL